MRALKIGVIVGGILFLIGLAGLVHIMNKQSDKKVAEGPVPLHTFTAFPGAKVVQIHSSGAGTVLLLENTDGSQEVITLNHKGKPVGRTRMALSGGGAATTAGPAATPQP